MQDGPQEHKRIILTESQAVSIYKQKPEICHKEINRRAASRSRLVSVNYGISSKTVRDIWNRKTWLFATHHLCKFEAKNGESGSSEVCNISIYKVIM